MQKILKMVIVINFFTFFFLLISTQSVASEKTVYEVISKNENLSKFYEYVQLTGLDVVLKKKLPWGWTVFAPNNSAFKEFEEKNNFILADNFLIKNLIMDHILIGKKSSQNLGEAIVIEKTVSNKPLQLYKTSEIHVKDMIVINEDISAGNGIVHSIGCVMYVQPSIEDPRLTKEEKENYAITSCCMREQKEVNAWKSSIKAR